MCIIVIKPAGTTLPSATTLETCWEDNPDGAGIMYARDGAVHIEKGFMKLKSLKSRLRTLEKEIDIPNTTMILHFRIGTSGGKSPANTHPFPVSKSLDDLTKVVTTCDMAVAHNGIISIPIRSKNISDTMEYVLSQLSLLREIAPNFCELPTAMELIENQTTYSKLVFLTGDGRYFTTGKYVEDEGLLYSNYGYKLSWKLWDDKKWLDYDKTDYAKIDYTGIDEVDGTTKTARARLVFLNSENEYILEDNGNMTSAEDYMIGKNGDLYYYDEEIDLAIPANDARLVPMWGKCTQWHKEDAYMMDVLL